MPIKLNHTIVYARDKHASAMFLAEILGLPGPVPGGARWNSPVAAPGYRRMVAAWTDDLYNVDRCLAKRPTP